MSEPSPTPTPTSSAPVSGRGRRRSLAPPGRRRGLGGAHERGHRVRRLVPVVALVALAAAVAACTSSGSTTAAGGSATTAAGGRAAAGTTVAGADPVASLPTLRATATEHADGAAMAYGFDGPTSVPAGKVLVEVRNDGKEEHQAAVARLAPGVTYEQLEAAIATNPMAGFPSSRPWAGRLASPPGPPARASSP